MKIDDARLVDIGKYLVVAENIAGKDQTSCETFVLNTANVDDKPLIDPSAFVSLEKVPDPMKYDKPVKVPAGKPPKFIVHLPEKVKFKDGERIHLKCKVEGSPAPKVFDFKR